VDFKRTFENQARKKLRKFLDTLLTPIGQPKSFGGRPTFWSPAKSSTEKLVARRNFLVGRQVVYRKVGGRLGGQPTFRWTTWRSTQKFWWAGNFSVDDLAADRKVSAGSRLFGCPIGVSKVTKFFRNFLRAWFSEVLLKSTFGHHFLSLFKHPKKIFY